MINGCMVATYRMKSGNAAGSIPRKKTGLLTTAVTTRAEATPER